MKNMLMLFLTTFFLTSMASCTYNISMAHTSGMADDVIDDNASNTPNISPNITVPLTPGSEVRVTK